ncbi:unnamed protein product [Urochloa humidicola]
MATKVYIVYYSTWGHVATLAEEIKKGAESVAGVEETVWRVAETLPEEVLGKMHAPPKREDHPVITAQQLAEADGVLLGSPTRFGTMAAQMKAFLDSTGGLWQAQALAGKPAGLFFTTGTQGGGQETTALTAVPSRSSPTMACTLSPSGPPSAPACSAPTRSEEATRTGRAPSPAPTAAGRPATPSSPWPTYFAGIAKRL